MTQPTTASLAESPQPIVISQYDVLLGDIKEAQDAELPAFDYNTKQGITLAKSHVFQLRKLRARIESARKDAKSYALAYGKKVDEQAKLLSGQVDELIAPVQSRLDEIATREAERVQRHQLVLDRANGLGVVAFGATSRDIRALLAQLDGISLDGLEEFTERVAAAIVKSRQALGLALEQATAAEEQARLAQEQADELARLRAAEEERQAQERQAQMLREAQERADAEAQAAAEDQIAAAEARARAAEAKLALSQQAQAATPVPVPPVAPTPATEVVADRGAFVQGRAKSEPRLTPSQTTMEAATRSLSRELMQAVAGKDRSDVVQAILSGTLHPCVVVDWAKVSQGWRAG
jgi:hypothetical protein